MCQMFFVFFLVDRNECEEWGYCDQLCTNTEGSYSCSCFPGYELLDRARCASPNSSSLLIFFAHDRSVIRMDVHGSNQILVANTTAASGLDFNFQKNLLYWTDTKTRKVYNVNIYHKMWNIIFSIFTKQMENLNVFSDNYIIVLYYVL